MAEFVRLDFDVKSVQKAIDDLPETARKVSASTINKVGRKANTAARKFITSQYNIKARSLKLGKLVNLRRADARKPNPVFNIFIRKQGRGLFKYGAKQLKSGVSVRVLKTRTNIKGAFIAPWRRGQDERFVFLRDRDKRLGTIGRNSRVKRRSLFGPSIAQLYNSRKVRVIINKTIADNYQKTVNEDFSKKLAKKIRLK